ncbi:response regulator transcription factor [Streptomyces sp. URMC 124]|uniref:response regulator transcription factor n=1 Tax=Streptomyces sp. URMC 124 TaxID=3423405 RepID=UPI003F1DB6E0
MTRPVNPGAPLTDREIQILHGLTRGIGLAAVGQELGITHDTVKSHAVRIYRKLGANGAAHAIAIGYRQGLLAVDSVIRPDRSK